MFRLALAALLVSGFASASDGTYMARLNQCNSGAINCMVKIDEFIKVDAPKHGVSKKQLGVLRSKAIAFCKANPSDDTCSLREGDYNSGVFITYLRLVDSAYIPN